MSDISGVFSARHGRAQDVFTDRVPESEAFAAALREHRTKLAQSILHLDAPRHNVVVFYGAGGIGKSALSHRLELWGRGLLSVDDPWGEAPAVRPELITRHDCAGSTSPRVENLLIALRASAAANGIPTPAFDVGYLAYWSSVSPGSPIEFDSPNQSRTTINEQLVESVKASLTEFGLTYGTAGLGVRTVQTLREYLKRRDARKHLAACPYLEPVLGGIIRDPVGTVPLLAGLLHWDMIQLTNPRPLWVTFVDAYEHVAGPAHRDGEKRLQTAIHLLPEVLFAITGRHRLDWASESLVGTLDHVGPRIWPDLAEDTKGRGGQHLVGDLSDEDGDQYLQRVLVDQDGTPLLSSECRGRIVHAAHGLPLYLDLSVTIAQDLLAARQPLTADAFGKPLPQVVLGIVRDMPAAQRDALRAASVFHGFDVNLVAAAGDVTHHAANALARHNIVSSHGLPPLELRIHDAVRDAILTGVDLGEDGWAPADFEAAARRGLDHLQQRVQSTLDAAQRMTFVAVALRLAEEQNIDADWIRVEAFKLPLRRLAQLIGTPPENPTSAAGWLHYHLASWTIPPDRNLDRFGRFERIAENESVPIKVRFSAMRHLAYGRRGYGDKPAALPLLKHLLEEDPTNKRLHRYQLGLTYRDLNHFKQVFEIAEELGTEEPDLYGNRLHAALAIAHGRPQDAATVYHRRADHLESRGDARVSSEVRIAAFHTQAFLDPSVDSAATELLAQAEELYAPSDMYQALATRMLCHAGDSEAVKSLAADQQALAASFGGDPHGVPMVVPVAFHELVKGDTKAAARHIRRFSQSRRHPVSYWYDILAGLLVDLGGEHLPPNDAAPDWLEHYDPRGNWVAIVMQRRSRLGTVS
jgi:hypothetical protein